MLDCIPYSYRLTSVVPGIPLINFNDGGEGSDRGLYFIPKKITTSEFVNPKKSLLFLAYPPLKSLSPFSATQKYLSFLRPQKFLAYFMDPKKSLWAKISDPKNHSDPPPPPSVIKICEWGPLECSLEVLVTATNLCKQLRKHLRGLV